MNTNQKQDDIANLLIIILARRNITLAYLDAHQIAREMWETIKKP
jgi:hypothetical protein